MRLTAIYFLTKRKDFMSFEIFKTLEKLKQKVAMLEMSINSVESTVIVWGKFSISIEFNSNWMYYQLL